jgi:OOP family OmpA-OmpF porin
MRLLVTSIGLLCALVALTTGMTQESPPAQSPPVPEFVITVKPASLVIDGIVSSEGHKAILSRTVARLFPGRSVQVDVEVRPALPPGWALITDLTLQAMATTRSATAGITPDSISISGITTDADAWSRAAQLIDRSLLDGQAFEQHVEVAGSPASLERQCIALFRTAIRGRRIEFPRSGVALGTAAHPLLDELIQIAVDCPAASILITGHTDNTGEEAMNTALSQARADAVANYLVSRGISAGRIETRGVGSSEPLVDGASARARRLNRRIDIDLRFP